MQQGNNPTLLGYPEPSRHGSLLDLCPGRMRSLLFTAAKIRGCLPPHDTRSIEKRTAKQPLSRPRSCSASVEYETRLYDVVLEEEEDDDDDEALLLLRW